MKKASVYFKSNNMFGMISLTVLCFISCFLFGRSHLSNPNGQRNLAPCWIPEKRKPSLMDKHTVTLIQHVCKNVTCPSVCVCKYVLGWGIHFLSFSLMACTGLPAPLLCGLLWWGQLKQATKSLSLHVFLSHGALGEYRLVPPPARGPVSFLFSSHSCLDSNGSLSTQELLRWNMFSPLLFSGWTKTGHTLLGPPLSLAGHCSAWGKSIWSLLSISLVWPCLSTWHWTKADCLCVYGFARVSSRYWEPNT